MPSIRQFIIDNPHLFSEDSDYSDYESEEDNDSDDEEENIAENSSSRNDLNFSPIFQQSSQKPSKMGRPSGRRLDIVTFHEDAFDSPLNLFQAQGCECPSNESLMGDVNEFRKNYLTVFRVYDVIVNYKVKSKVL